MTAFRQRRRARNPYHGFDEPPAPRRARPIIPEDDIRILKPAVITMMVLERIDKRAGDAEPCTFAELCLVVGGENAPELKRTLLRLEREGRITGKVEGRAIAWRPA
jgi:hypothetical protein